MAMMRQRWQRWTVLVLVVATGLFAGRRAWGEEDFIEFLRGLHNLGHGDLAVHYLNQIKDRPDLPDDVKTTWDLEMARSLRVAANETPNTDLQQKFIVEAQQSLDKFLKEQPNHEEAASAQMTSGDISLFRSQNALRVGLRDKAKKDELIPEARKLLGEARPKYEKAVSMYKERVDKARAGIGKNKVLNPKAQRQFAALVEAWYNARFKVATVDYNVGLTYTEPAAPPRKEALQKSYKGFDSIYQENRDERVGIYAKMWEGKALEELGDFENALEIYNEVMSAAPPDKDKRQADYAAMFQEVNRYRLMLLGRTKRYDDLVRDATLWLNAYDSAKRTNGYQGIALELAKAHLELAKTRKGVEATKSAKEAKDLLTAIIKVPSDFQKDAILLQRLSAGGQEVPLASFDEAIAVADAAAKAASEATAPADVKTNWQEAEKAYSKAIELSADVKDKTRVLHTRFALATAQYMVGKAAEGYATALTLAKENTSYAKAPAAASLAVNIALYLYGQTRDAAAMDRINESTELLLKQWPQHAEADDARIAKGKLKLLQRDLKGAIEVFLGVNSASDRYPTALQFASQTYWALYLPLKMSDAEEAKKVRVKAVELTEKCLAAFEKIEAKGPLVQSQREAQLLMAEIKMEEAQFSEAAKYLQPLLDETKRQPLTSLDQYTRRLLVYSLKTFSTLEMNNEVGDVGNLLVSAGEDSPLINSTSIEYAKIARVEYLRESKRTAEELAAAEQKGEEGLINNAKAAQTNVREKYHDLLTKLSARKQYDIAGLLYLADATFEAELPEKARDQYQAIIDRASSDPAFAKLAAKAMTRVRSQLIGLLRAEKNYDESLKQVEALLKEQPNALEPLIEKGNILQALAEADPKRYDEAAKWWTSIRLKLQSTAGKKPPAYYEVVYNCAVCLAAQKQAEKSAQAAQLLNATLVLSPDLDGPDRVEKYKALQKQLPATKAAPGKAATKPAK
jgi:hypothetical protein